MIQNERQYRITKAEAEKFERLIQHLEADKESSLDTHEKLRKAEIEGLRSQLADLRLQLKDYDDLQSGRRIIIEGVSLASLPQSLVKCRIAAKLSQRQLADRLKMKEQQIQKYEATGYAGASMSRLVEIADAVGLKLRKDVFLPGNYSGNFDIFRRLSDIGLEKDFVIHKLLPQDISSKASSREGSRDPEVVFQATAVVSHIFGWTPEAIIGTDRLFIDKGVLGAARFKVSAKAEERRLSAYAFYAHFLALHLLEATAAIPTRPVTTDSSSVREAICDKYGALSLRNALYYVWDLGIPVLPLNDSGAFHGAAWRENGRNVLVLKQSTMSQARWLHDLMHELFHAGQEPEKKQRSIIEAPETDVERRESEEEWDATHFAANVILNGRAEELAKICVDATRSHTNSIGSIERLKSVLPSVALKEGVPVDSLANYLAFRLSLQGFDWWGTAQNLQNTTEDPWLIARDVLLERVNLNDLDSVDKGLLIRALSDVDA